MKMKAVTELTGLTDRAVRLYIDNGLVRPEISENYAGRKNIDFSEKDIETLGNISVLRKAGFSISEIRSLFCENDESRETLMLFIKNTEKQIEDKNDIVMRLKAFDEKREISVKAVCDALSSSVIDDKMPDEDMVHSERDESDRKFSVVFSVIFIIFPILVYVVITVTNYFSFRYSVITADDLLWNLMFCSGWVVIFLLATVSFLLCRKKYSFSKGRKRRKTASEILILFIIALLLPSSGLSLFALGFPSVYSQTSDASDYLVLDSDVEQIYGVDIMKIFPESIPESADIRYGNDIPTYPYTTRYYYMFDFRWDMSFDLFAEWSLNEEEFEKAVEEAPDDFVHSEYKGNWKCLYYLDTEQIVAEDPRYYSYLIFAYNEQTRSVRYIASYAVDSVDGPYYQGVAW